MKALLILAIFLNFFNGHVSCQTKPIKIVFASTQKDTATELDQTKVYRLKKKAINADFDYSKLKNIDGNNKDTLNIENLMPIFEPVNGHFTYYQFISTFKGHSFQEVDKEFHDILIIKTDGSNKIIDAYQYTLEWAEPPLQHDLFKSHVKGLTLADNLEITSLMLMRTDNWDENDKILKDNGHIFLK